MRCFSYVLLIAATFFNCANLRAYGFAKEVSYDPVDLQYDIVRAEGYEIPFIAIKTGDLSISADIDYDWKLVRGDDSKSLKLVYKRLPDAQIKLAFTSVKLENKATFEEWVQRLLVKASADNTSLFTRAHDDFVGMSRKEFSEAKMVSDEDPSAVLNLILPAQPSPFRAQSIEFLHHKIQADGTVRTTLGVWLRFREKVAYVELEAPPELLIDVRDSLYGHLCFYNIETERHTLVAPPY